MRLWQRRIVPSYQNSTPSFPSCHGPGIDRTRRDQQEQNQPPEPETAAGEESDEEGEEIPDEKAEAAKKRLGRSAVDVNKNHTGQAGTPDIILQAIIRHQNTNPGHILNE